MDKKAQSGEAILMIVRLFLIMIIAFAIYSITSLYLNYHLDTRPIEASLLSSQITDCIAPNLEVNNIREIKSLGDGVLSYCNIKGAINSYIFVNITYGEDIVFLEENTVHKESGSIYDRIGDSKKIVEIYRPGSFVLENEVKIINEGTTDMATIKVGANILNDK